MHRNNTDVLNVKKLKKDGSIDSALFKVLVNYLKEGKSIIMPVDSIYGTIRLDNEENIQLMTKNQNGNTKQIVRLVSNFKMLEEISLLGKLEFDFLHRVWPGEMIVYLASRKKEGIKIPLQMPKGKLYQEMINKISNPVLFSPLMDEKNKLVYQKKSLINDYKKHVDCIFIIDEFCKEHTLPTVLDISEGTLTIVNEGRVSSDEIKSLYFLGKDDSVV